MLNFRHSYLVKLTAFQQLVRFYFPFDVALSGLVALVFSATFVWSAPQETQNAGATQTVIWSFVLLRWLWWIFYVYRTVKPIDVWRSTNRQSSEFQKIVSDAFETGLKAPMRFAIVNGFSGAIQWIATVTICVLMDFFAPREAAFLVGAYTWAFAIGFGGFVFALVVMRLLLRPFVESISTEFADYNPQRDLPPKNLKNELAAFSLCLVVAPMCAYIAHSLEQNLVQQRQGIETHLDRALADYIINGRRAPGVLFFPVGKNGNVSEALDDRPNWLPTLKPNERNYRNGRDGVFVRRIETPNGDVIVARRTDVLFDREFLFFHLLTLLAIGIWAPLCAIFFGGHLVASINSIYDALYSVRSHSTVRYQRPPVLRNDEIGALAVVTTEMVARLETSEAAIADVLFQLQLKNNELTNSFQAKSRFLALMSHELRTPLNAIIGFTSIILRRLETGRDVSELDLNKNLNLVQKSGEHLLMLVNDLLDFEKMEAGALAVENRDVPLAEVILSVHEVLLDHAERKNLTFIVAPFDQTLAIHSDPERLRQILNNLVTNAIKYSDTGTITMRVIRLDNEIGIEVEDEGIGIDDDFIDSIFEPFNQADIDITRSADGAGLGLAIVTKLVSLLHGRITLTSEEGVGSKFTVFFPANDRQLSDPIDDSEE